MQPLEQKLQGSRCSSQIIASKEKKRSQGKVRWLSIVWKVKFLCLGHFECYLPWHQVYSPVAFSSHAYQWLSLIQAFIHFNPICVTGHLHRPYVCHHDEICPFLLGFDTWYCRFRQSKSCAGDEWMFVYNIRARCVIAQMWILKRRVWVIIKWE